MKKLITMFAVGALAAGSAFADKEGGERKGGDKPKGERPERAEGERKRPEGGDRKRPEGGERHGPGQMLKALDTDKSGDISFDEFKAGPRAKDKPEDKVKEFFDKMDKDSDGKIGEADFALIRKAMEERRKAGGDRPKRPEGAKDGERPERPKREGGDRPKRPEGDKKEG